MVNGWELVLGAACGVSSYKRVVVRCLRERSGRVWSRELTGMEWVRYDLDD